MKNSLFNWKRFKGSFVYAWSGIWRLLKTEQNLWIILFLGVLAVVMAWCWNLTALEKAVIVLTSAMVLAAEILNTTVEFISEKFHLENQAEIEIIKNMMAGFVLILAMAAVVIGLLIFWPHIK